MLFTLKVSSGAHSPIIGIIIGERQKSFDLFFAHTVDGYQGGNPATRRETGLTLARDLSKANAAHARHCGKGGGT